MSAPPLGGRTVVLTRPEGRGDALREELEALGATVLAVPTIHFAPPDETAAWDAAARRADRSTHLVFASATAVEWFVAACRRSGLATDAWRERCVAAVGEATARAVRAAGVHDRPVVGGAGGAALGRRLVESGSVDARSVVWIPGSVQARPELPDELRAAGAEVLLLPVYATLPATPERAAELLGALDTGTTVDAVVFASPSALDGFLRATGPRGERLLEGPPPVAVSIGPTTSAAVRAAGLPIAAEAPSPGTEGLLKALRVALRA